MDGCAVSRSQPPAFSERSLCHPVNMSLSLPARASAPKAECEPSGAAVVCGMSFVSIATSLLGASVFLSPAFAEEEAAAAFPNFVLVRGGRV